jgi:uncharacterized membrane protein YccC
VSQLVGRTLHALEPVAPDWFVQVVAPKQAPVPWPNMIRAAASVTVPLGVGVVLGQGPLGGFAAMGALLGSFGDAGGPFLRRLRRVSLGAAGGLIGLLLGRLLLNSGLWAVAIVGGVAVLSAVVTALSAEMSFAGLQLLVYLAVSTGPAHVVPLPPLCLLFLTGAGWAVVLSYVQTRILPEEDRPQQAVARVLGELIELLRVMAGDGPAATRQDEIAQGRRRVGMALGTAYDAVTTARAHSAGGRSDLRRLNAVLSAVSNLVAVAVASARTDPVEPASAIPDLEALRDRIASGKRRAAPRTLPTAEQLAQNPTASALARAISHLEHSGDETSRRHSLPAITTAIALGQVRPATPRSRSRARPRSIEAVTDALAGRKTWVFAARLAVTLMVAETAVQLLPLTRSYWVLLTVAVVLKPDLGSVFARGVQRTLGTVVGVLIGAAVVTLVPEGPWLLVPVAFFSLLFPFGASRNYGMLSTFITPLVLILIDFGGASLSGVAADRLLDTAIGAAIVFVVGYLLWPGTWRPQLGRTIADGIDAIADYADAAFSGGASSIIAPVRRRAFGATSDIRSDLQSLLAEPTKQAREAANWFPLVAQLEQTADDLRDAAVLDIRIPAESVGTDAQRISAGLRDLATAVREQRPPSDSALPDTGILMNVAGDILGARRILTGPPPSGSADDSEGEPLGRG